MGKICAIKWCLNTVNYYVDDINDTRECRNCTEKAKD